ncbi:MAG TPA: FAD-dependent oxidoreductase, partial [Chthoniobacterales bacterium]
VSRAEMSRRYPTLKLAPNETAIFDPEAGVLKPERAIAAHLAVAERAGAEMRFGVTMRDWAATDSGIEVCLTSGERVGTKTLVLALGPWFERVLRELGVELRVQRNVQVWFAPRTSAYHASRFPAFLVDRSELPAPLYGFPDFGEGVKAAFHGFGDLTNPDELDREIDEQRDIAPLVRAMEEWMPGSTGAVIDTKACMYSLTPDSHFVVDRHPQHPGLVVCGGFSGHGFKFASVIGEVAADLALDGATRHAIEILSLRRFASGK